jgi:phospholipase C
VIHETLVRCLSLTLCLSIFLSGCSGGSLSSSTTTTTTTTTATTPSTAIKHIVVIFNENVSFDHYFGTYPNATNPAGEPSFMAAAGTPTPTGLTSALLSSNPNLANTKNGAGASNPFRLDIKQAATGDEDHNYGPEQSAFDNGAMDLFPFSVGVPDSPALASSTDAAPIAATNGLTMGYFDGNTVTALWNYAQHYALNDHFFGTNFGASTAGAINLVSGQTNGVVLGPNASSAVVSDGYGGYTATIGADPTGDVCSTTSGDTISMTGPNIGELLTKANISWGWFEGGFNLTVTNPNGTTDCERSTTSSVTNASVTDYQADHEPFQYYASTQNLEHTRPSSVAAIGSNNDGANHQYDVTDFTAALAAGNLPAVSFLKPPSYQDAHAGYSDPLDEQTFMVGIINSIEQSSFWPNTAIIITYDDSDGWYDQLINIVNGSSTTSDALAGPGNCSTSTVSSADALSGVNSSTLHAQGRCGYGPRIPLLVISPWAKANYLDSTVTDQSSIPRFIEDIFLNSTRLGGGSFDSIAGSIENMFDFSQTAGQNGGILQLSPSTGEVASGN